MSYIKRTKDFHFFQPLKRNIRAVKYEEIYSLDRENLYLTGNWSSELSEAIAQSGVSQIIVQHWSDPDLGFLSNFTAQIRQLWIQQPIEDISVVNQLRNLEDLYLTKTVEQIDFTELPKLRKCGISTSRTLGNIAAAPHLEDLTIIAVEKVSLATVARLRSLKRLDLQEISLEDICGIDGSSNIEEFYIRKCKTQNLNGIEKMRGLKVLMLASLKSLKNISQIGKLANLEELDIDACKNVQDLQEVGKLFSLQKLSLGNLGRIESLSFLKHLPRLTDLSFWDSTNFANGDLGILLQFPRLKRVGFKNRKHYSHTMEEINLALTKNRA